MPIKKLYILITLLSLCSCSTIESLRQENINNKINKNITTSTTFQQDKNFLLDELSTSNVESINQRAIEQAIYKPMYSISYIDDNGIINYESEETHGYFLHKDRGNDAYKEALDNVHFRKALLALFTHEQYSLTTYNKKIRDKDSHHIHSSTYKSSPSISEIIIEEGITIAKKEYQLALETGLKMDKIELYLTSDYPQKMPDAHSLLISYINEIFDYHVQITYKEAMSDLYYSAGVDTITIKGAYNFYSEVTLNSLRYPIEEGIKNVLNDFEYCDTEFSFPYKDN